MKNYKKILAVALVSCSLIGAAAFTAACTEPTETEQPHLHTLSKVAAKQSTCKDEGNIEYWTCSGCDKIFSDAEGETETTAAAVKTPLSTTHEHVTEHAAVDATCAVNGNIAYYTCDLCEKLFSDSEATTQITLEATVTTSDVHGATTPHSAVDATCKEQGMSAYWTCTVCEKNFSDEACKHEVTDLATLKTPLSTTHGATTPHSAVDATCKEQGTSAYWTCTVCEKNFSDEACEHEVTDLATLKTPLSTTHGATAHHDAVPATCKDEGTVEYWTCTVCEKNFSEEACTNELESIVDPISTTHGATTHTDAVPNSCDTDGNIEYWTCTVCNKKFSDEACTTEVENVVVPAAHNLTKTEAKEESCTEDGNDAYWTCSVCEKVFSDEACEHETTVEDSVIAKHHTPGDSHEAVLPVWSSTGTSDGKIAYWECAACDKKFSDAKCENEIASEDFVSPVIPAEGGVDQGTDIPGKTSFWRVTEGSTGTSASNGWYVYGNDDGCPNGTGLPTLHGTQDNPEYLEFTKAARFELFFVKDDLTVPGSSSNVHLGDNSGAWAAEKHEGLYGYTFYYDMQISANGAYSLEVCGKMNSVNGMIFTFAKNVVTLHEGTGVNNILGSATLPDTVNLTDGAQHRITFALCREAEVGLAVDLYVDGYFVPLEALGTTASVSVRNFSTYMAQKDGFGQRFSVIPLVNSEEGAETETYTTVKIHSLSITRFAPASAEETTPETQAEELATEAKNTVVE